MLTSWKSLWGVSAAGLVALSALPVEAVPLRIEYVAFDLQDVNAGKDLWRYTYYVSGYNFLATEGFDIYFDQSSYGVLSNPQPDNGPQWYAGASSVLVPGSPQIYDAITVVNNPSLETVFSVDFVWEGHGKPGAQPFDAFRTSASGGIETFARGVTAVPEGGPGLVLAGLAFGAFLHPGVLRWFRRREA